MSRVLLVSRRRADAAHPRPAPSPSPQASPRRVGAALAGAALLAGGGGAGVAAADGPSGPTGPASAPTTSSTQTPAPSAPRPGRPQRSQGSITTTTTGSSPGRASGGCAPGGAHQGAPPATGHCGTNPPAATTPAAVPASSTPAPAPVPALSPLASAAAALVPNFFVDNYRIPPFLLPIYQAAGIQYGVPWQVLAAINEIETDYGRNLSVSSAGAEGWMQFLPQSWRAYGVDAALTGRRDPYDPADAVFATARYLHAAGASRDLHGAIFAYNHADWYVASVLARARLIQGTPNDLTGALTGLAQGRFPVAGPARYPPMAGAAGAPSRPETATDITGPRGSAVVAAQDGVITAMGAGGARGTFVVLEDGSGNRFVYEQMGGLASSYPVLRDAGAHSAGAEPASLPADASPAASATAGDHALAPASGSPARSAPVVVPAAPRERLFANPQRPSALTAGGRAQIAVTRAARTGGGRRLAGSTDLGVPLDQLSSRALGPGAHVLAGTVLGSTGATPMRFAVRPAGTRSPRVDPRPLLDGWRLLASTALYRVGQAARSTGERLGLGQILLAGQPELERRVLANRRIDLSACGRAAVATGAVDRRVLGTLELLAASGLAPTVRSLPCPPAAPLAEPALAAHPTDDTVDITAVNRTPIAGHQGTGSITDVTIRRLLTLQGALKPKEIVSLMSYPRTDDTLSLPGYARRVRIAYRPQALIGTPTLAASLSPAQWRRLAARLASLSEPVLLRGPSGGALPDALPGLRRGR